MGSKIFLSLNIISLSETLAYAQVGLNTEERRNVKTTEKEQKKLKETKKIHLTAKS